MADPQLDPKLKEIYDRVMSTPVPAPVATPKPAAPTPAESPNPHAPPPASTPQPSPQPASALNKPQIFTSGGTNKTPHEKKGLNPVILIVGGIIFFIVYSIVWMKYFEFAPF